MTKRTSFERLREIPSKTGRLVTEDGNIISNSQKIILDYFSNASELALSGRLNFANSVRNVGSSQSTIFVIKTGSNNVVQFSRNLSISANFWDTEVLSGGVFSGGTLVSIRNTILENAPFGNTAEIYEGGTITGAIIEETDFIPGSSRNNDGGISGSSPGAIITYPPNSTFAVRCTNTGNSSAKISFQYIFSEITPIQMQKIRGIYVES